MELERIELSAKERERLKLLHEVKEGHLKQIEAARRLRLTDRHVRRLLARLGVEGDRGLVHQLRGRRSNRKIAEGFTARALRRLRQARYAGFGPTLAAEHLAAEGIGVSRETVRKWMSQAGLWQTHSRKGKPVHQSFSGNHFLAVLERALCRPGGPPRGRSSAAGAGASTGRDSEHPRGTHGGFGPYRDLERGALRTASGRCPRRNARRPSGDRTAARWQSLASFPRPVPATQALCESNAIRKSFRPTASGPRESPTETTSTQQTQIHSASRSPLAPDISTWQKSGHFYFALTFGFARAPAPPSRQPQAFLALAGKIE